MHNVAPLSDAALSSPPRPCPAASPLYFSLEIFTLRAWLSPGVRGDPAPRPRLTSSGRQWLLQAAPLCNALQQRGASRGKLTARPQPGNCSSFPGYKRRSAARPSASALPGQSPAAGSRVRIKLQVTQRWRCLRGGCEAGAEPRPQQEGERGRGREPAGSGARGKPSQVAGWRAARCRHRGELQPSSRSPLPCVAPCNAKSIRVNGSGMTAQANKVAPGGKIPFPNKQLGTQS